MIYYCNYTVYYSYLLGLVQTDKYDKRAEERSLAVEIWQISEMSSLYSDCWILNPADAKDRFQSPFLSYTQLFFLLKKNT